MTWCTQIAGQSHPAPSPGSATPRVAAAASEALDAAAASTCLALRTQKKRMSTASRTHSTSCIQASAAKHLRTA